MRVPSAYQTAIYDFTATGTDNGFVNAVAGSGKTTTLEGVCERFTPEQRERTIFLAFSKAIQVELEKRLPAGMWVRTTYAFGMYNLRNALKPVVRSWVEEYKYPNMIQRYLDYKGYAPGQERSEREQALLQAINFARLTLSDQDPDLFSQMCLRFDIDELPGLYGQVQELLERGMEIARDEIDYTDMVYLPVRMNIAVRGFDFILVDEAQDLSACQRALIHMMVRPQTRLLFVGDEKQSVFGFAGAEVDSVQHIVDEFSCTKLPLTICYRCPQSHIKLAQEIVPYIEARPNAPAGEVAHCEYTEVFSRVVPERGDLVMCRTNAPLVGLAFALIAAGVPAVLKGRDLMGQLINLAKATMKLPGANWNEFQTYLDEYVSRQISALRKKKGTDMRVQALIDRADALSVVVSRAQALDQRIKTLDGLSKFIERLYGQERGAVVLSSVHKAKGLEADHVFILGEELMPHPMATSDWAITQEFNLRYVALTRAKESLTFVALPPKEK